MGKWENEEEVRVGGRPSTGSGTTLRQAQGPPFDRLRDHPSTNAQGPRKWGNGKMGKSGNGKMRKRGNGKMGKRGRS